MYYVERYRQICKIHLKVLGVKKGKNLSGWSDIYGLMMIGVQQQQKIIFRATFF